MLLAIADVTPAFGQPQSVQGPGGNPQAAGLNTNPFAPGQQLILGARSNRRKLRGRPAGPAAPATTHHRLRGVGGNLPPLSVLPPRAPPLPAQPALSLPPPRERRPALPLPLCPAPRSRSPRSRHPRAFRPPAIRPPPARRSVRHKRACSRPAASPPPAPRAPQPRLIPHLSIRFPPAPRARFLRRPSHRSPRCRPRRESCPPGPLQQRQQPGAGIRRRRTRRHLTCQHSAGRSGVGCAGIGRRQHDRAGRRGRR